MLGRIGLFVLTNILIVVTLSVVASLLGVNRYMTQNGIDYQALLVFCSFWGMGGAFISLMLSRIMAKMIHRVKVIDPNNPGQYAGLVNMVSTIAKSANLPMPEVGVFESPTINAFATGPTKRRALVAVSSGMLQGMSRDEIEGVIGHEIAHIQNGDMVTMTLLQGVVNAFVMFFARIIAYAVTQRSDSDNRYMIQYLVRFVLEILLTVLGAVVVCWFSRRREFRADAGSAKLVGRADMIAALRRLQRQYGDADPRHASPGTATLMLNPGKRALLFSTHPPLEDRIAALEKYAG